MSSPREKERWRWPESSSSAPVLSNIAEMLAWGPGNDQEQGVIRNPREQRAQAAGGVLQVPRVARQAQDALGEVVFFDPPEVGATLAQAAAYAAANKGKAIARAPVARPTPTGGGAAESSSHGPGPGRGGGPGGWIGLPPPPPQP